HRFPGRFREPSGGLSARHPGRPASFLFAPTPGRSGRFQTPAGPVGAFDRSGLGGDFPLEIRPAVLRWRYESPFSPPGPTRLEPFRCGAADLAAGRGDRWFGPVVNYIE